MKHKNIIHLLILASLLILSNHLLASSHREAPLISSDPLADNVDVYAFRSPDNPDMVTLIATYVPMQLPQGGPNYYTFGKNIRYEVHVDNDASKPGDEITYRFTFNVTNEDPTTFFNIRLGKQNQKTTYKLERSIDRGVSFQTIIANGIAPPNNIGDRSISGGAGLNTTYAALFQGAITAASTGEKVFAGPTDDPFFVDLGGIFDLGDSPRQNGSSVDGLACYNVSAIAIQVPISTLKKTSAPTVPTSILDPDYVIGVWASASRQAVTTLSKTSEPTYSGNWIQVSRLGMPLTNEAVIPVGFKDYWNSITPYDELADTTLDQYFYNPELALYMDDDLFGGAVPAFRSLRIQQKSLGSFDFTNGANGLYGLKGNAALSGSALDDAVFGTLLLPGPGKPRSVDLWPAFHTGVPNVIPYQLATGKGGNPLAAGKPFVNNFLPNGGDMLRLNMAVPPTQRNDPNFSSLGLIQAAAFGLTVAPFNSTKNLEFIPNMDGFPNGRRLEDDVTRIELQAVAGVVLAAVGLWYDDYNPATSASPVTKQLLNVLTYSTGVEKNDKAFSTAFPYLAMPHSGTGACSGQPIVKQPNVAIFDPKFSGNILISARMNGGNEVPVVTTDAIGVATITFNDTYSQATINMTVANLSSLFQGVHIHSGKSGVNGPVKFDLTSKYKQGRMTSTFAVTKEDVAAFIDGDFYLNVHTTNFPGGELRGQLSLEAAESFGAELNGTNEVPAVNTTGKGLASVIYTANTNILEINLLATKLTGPITGIHFHKGAPGVSGAVIEDLKPFLIGNTIMVKFNPGAYIQDLRAGNIYINIHTDAFPGGEIRGQVSGIKGLHFDAWMTYDQEVPRVDNNTLALSMGFVTSTLDRLSYRILIDNPVSTITAAHIHKGNLGVAGGVVVDLSKGISGHSISGDSVVVTKDLLSDFLSGSLYFNVHSPTYPAGEVRGQIYRIARDGYSYDLCPQQQTPPVTNAGNASGSGMFAFNRDYDEAHMMVVASELSTPFQSAHIHNGPIGSSGPVVFDFGDKWLKNGAFFYYTDAFTASLANQIQSGTSYVNVHTTKNPNGEIRGQITKKPECAFQSAVVEVGNETFMIDVFPNPVSNMIKIKYEGSRALYQNSIVQIRDISGKLMVSKIISDPELTIDMTTFASGVYFIQAGNEVYRKSMKVIKI